MRPYLAVIRDSFREAFSSKVLWIVLVLITLILVLLSGVGLDVRQSSLLSSEEVTSPLQLAQMLSNGAKNDTNNVWRYVWNRFPADLQQKIDSLTEGEEGPDVHAVFEVVDELRAELNRQIESPDFYDEAAFADVLLSREARTLKEQGVENLTSDERQRFHRLLLESSFPKYIRHVQDGRVYLSYFAWEIDEPLPVITGEMVESIVKSAALTVMIWTVRIVGIFVAILVTASIVPQMFASGEIDLLLSKPVHRWALFLTKFVGGCAFALVMTGYFVLGVWLILGIRHGVWDPKLLLAIPIFLFVFAVYYAVSAAAGAVYRSTLIAIIASIVFWLCGFIVGTAHEWTLALMLNGERPHEIVVAGDDVLVAQKSGQTVVWRESLQLWDPVLSGTGAAHPGVGTGLTYPMIGPVRYSGGLAAIRQLPNPIRPFEQSVAGSLIVATDESGWHGVDAGMVPTATRSLLVGPEDSLFAVAFDGIHVFTGDLNDVSTASENRPMLFDFSFGSSGDKWKRITRRDVPTWSEPITAAINPDSGEIVVVESGRMHLVTRDVDETLTVTKTRDDLPFTAAVTGFGARAIVAAGDDGVVRTFDPQTLETLDEATPFRDELPRAVTVSPDGSRVAVVFHSNDLWVAEISDDGRLSGIMTESGATAAAFGADNRLFVGDRFPRVTEYSPDGRRIRSLETPSGLVKAFLYVIRPLHAILPIPSEMDAVSEYYLLDPESRVVGDANDLTSARVTPDVVGPALRNSIFIVVVLGLTCLYVSRRDF